MDKSPIRAPVARLATGIASLLLLPWIGPTALRADSSWQPLPDGEIRRIAFGSCAKQWEPQPLWRSVLAAEPDLFVFLGDVIYGDWHGEQPFVPTAGSLAKDYAQLAENPAFAAVRKKVPFMATWDNHDYGKHDGGAEFELKEVSRRVFLDFFGEPADSPRRRRDGIYDARIFGPPGRRVQVILLDGRWRRGPLMPDTRSKEQRAALGVTGSMGHIPNADPDATLLGASQWRWLEEQLRKPAEVRLIASATQVIPDQKGMQEWGNFPLERERLFDLIERTGASGVLILSGNVHFAELSRISQGRYPVYEFTSSGLTHVNPAYARAANRYRVAGPDVAPNFGLVEIDWDAQPTPVIRLVARGLAEDPAFEYRLSIADLE